MATEMVIRKRRNEIRGDSLSVCGDIEAKSVLGKTSRT